MSVLQDGASDGAVELRIKAIELAVGAAAALNHRYCHAPDLLDLDRDEVAGLDRARSMR